jgi:2-ketocyclohexanecarboxyl-CoA hydrolase
MGSVDPGFGTAYLARVVGEKKAREMWYLCRRDSAEEALRMGPSSMTPKESREGAAAMMAKRPPDRARFRR